METVNFFDNLSAEERPPRLDTPNILPIETRQVGTAVMEQLEDPSRDIVVSQDSGLPATFDPDGAFEELYEASRRIVPLDATTQELNTTNSTQATDQEQVEQDNTNSTQATGQEQVELNTTNSRQATGQEQVEQDNTSSADQEQIPPKVIKRRAARKPEYHAIVGHKSRSIKDGVFFEVLLFEGKDQKVKLNSRHVIREEKAAAISAYLRSLSKSRANILVTRDDMEALRDLIKSGIVSF